MTVSVSSIDEEDTVELLNSDLRNSELLNNELLNNEEIGSVIAVVRATKSELNDATVMICYPEYWIG